MNAWTIALDSIWHHKLRSALTALGVVIGVFAVVTLTSLGAGVRQYITGQFNHFGANVITVIPAPPGSASGRTRGDRGGFAPTPSTLTMGDAQAIAGLTSDHVIAAAPVANAVAQVTHGDAVAPGGAVIGTTAPYFDIEQLKFGAGGVPADFASGAVLGHDVATALFGATSPLGQTVEINGQSFEVAGVLQSAGTQFGTSPDSAVYIPVAQALSISGSRNLSQTVALASASATVQAASAAVTALLTERHPLQDFRVLTAAQVLSIITSTLSVITSVLGGIAAISLLVGGIGIMNIMLVTVTERTREIGTRKAMGARDSDILVQFLVESVLLAGLGGAIGTALSSLASSIVGHVIHLPVGLTTSSVIVALAFSVGVGAIFGVLPAWNAGRLMPADALRSE